MSAKAFVWIILVAVLLLVGWYLMQRGRKPVGTSWEAFWDGPDRGELFYEQDRQDWDVLLEEWRWKLGDDAEVFRVTIFGDLYVREPDGSIGWLDVGGARYVDAAESATAWVEEARTHGAEWFHWDILRELMGHGVRPPAGQVYSWINDPMLGGSRSVDNIHFISPWVQVARAGMVAEQLDGLPPGTRVAGIKFTALGPGDVGPEATEAGGEAEDDTVWAVVVNEEEQYSIWPAGEELPPGWKAEGKTGTQSECVDHIAEVWTDMRPLSVRKKMGQR